MPWVAAAGGIVLLAILTGRGGDLARALAGDGGSLFGIQMPIANPVGIGAGGLVPSYAPDASVDRPSFSAATSTSTLTSPTTAATLPPAPSQPPPTSRFVPGGNYEPAYAASAIPPPRVSGASSGPSGGSGGRLGAGNVALIQFVNSQQSSSVGGFNPVRARSSGTQAI